ncbi:MAG: hypothetical protein GEU95_15165 [Rhizobiales bacterium]|nr:hypothetical protein [Hyphomicrobiales bacterium]
MSNDAQQTHEERLKRRLHLLKAELEAGNLHIGSDPNIARELQAVRHREDGEIDLNTVGGGVRALAVEAMNHRQQTKQVISLQELQHGYFESIEKVFGNLYRDMQREGATPFQVASSVARDPDGVRIFRKAIPEVVSWVSNLWEDAHEVAHIHAQDINGLKSVFGGETFPQGKKNIVSCTGIYVDTTILPDPFLRARVFLEGPDPEIAVRYFVSGGLSLLQYKEAALAEIDVPLVAVVPDQLYLNDQICERVFRLADDDAVEHLKSMFGVQLSNLDEAHEFLKKFETASEVTARLTNPDLLLFDVRDTGPAEANIESYINKFFVPFEPGRTRWKGRSVLLCRTDETGQ